MPIASVTTPPLFTRVSSTSWFRALVNIGAGTQPTGLSSGTSFLLFVADSTNGSYLDRVIFQPLGGQDAIVGRVWLNNGLAVADEDNNTMIQEVALPKTNESSTVVLGTVVAPVGMALAPGHRVFITFTSNAKIGFDVTGIGGPY